MSELSNSEQAEVSDIARAIGDSFDRDDRWRVDETGKLVMAGDRKLYVHVGSGASGVYVWKRGAGGMWDGGNKSATASQRHVWQAFQRWQARRMLEHSQLRRGRRS